jgi:hypothetical protein
MQTTFFQRNGAIDFIGSFVAAVAPRLPRIAGITLLVMALAFVGVHLQPAKYQARLDLPYSGEVPADEQIAEFLDPVHLADIVARLPQSAVQELRSADASLDSITLLRRTLTISPGADGKSLRVEAVARTEANARAIAAAIAASHALAQPILAAPPTAETPQPSATPAKTPLPRAQLVPRAQLGDADIGVLQQRMTLAWENRVTLEEKARRIESLVASNDYAALGLHAESLPGLARRLDDLLTLEADRKKLAVTLLPNHPNMRAIAEEIALANAEIGEQAGQLVAMMRADSEAARKLEATLRGEYEAQLASRTVDDTILTGSTNGDPAPSVTALSRPVSTTLALGLAGGFAFFGQLGLIALQQPVAASAPLPVRAPRTPRRKKQIDRTLAIAVEPNDAMAPAPIMHAVEPPPAPAPQAERPQIAPEPVRAVPSPEHNWFSGDLSQPQIAIAASWIGTPATEPTRVERARPTPETAPADSQQRVGDLRLADARIVAIRSRGTPGDTRAKARELLETYAEDGKRVVLIDAASRRRGSAPGISDLSMGKARFADIIHGTGAEEAALIPWGRQDMLDASARPVRTLLLALVELYDVVVITLDAEAGGSSHLAAMADLVLTATPAPEAPRRKQRVAHWQ